MNMFLVSFVYDFEAVMRTMFKEQLSEKIVESFAHLA